MNTITKIDLERMLLDEAVEPKALPFYLLAEITNGFSNDLEIGRGGFAVVYKAMLETRYVAVKRLSSSSYLYEKEFHREIECLMKVRHKNIVQFLGYCADTHGNVGSYNGKFVIADLQHRLLCFEYLPKGNLHDYIEDASSGLEWRDRYKIIKGICEGLCYLHQENIVHLDLKPENILLDDNMRPKITDFGLSRCFEDNQTRIITSKVGGTRGYLAPEFSDKEITYKFDLYSLGVIILEILTGKKGYQDIEDVLENWGNRLHISQGSPEWELIKVCAKIGVECTEFNPKKRPSSVKDIIVRLVQMEGDEMISFASNEDKKEYTCSDDADNKDTMLRRLEELIQFTGGFSEVIWEGSSAIIYKGIDEEKNEIAVKVLNERKGSSQEQEFKREIEIQLTLSHQNIVQLVGYCYEIGNRYDSVLRRYDPIIRTILCFEHAPEGNLGKHMSDNGDRLDWPTCYKIIKGTCEGLCYLHHHPSGFQILHLDLKPENIWLDHDMIPKIADFHLSMHITGQTSEATVDPVGTGKYTPLEYKKRRLISKEFDIYSLGVIILELIAGTKTYEETDDFTQKDADLAFEKWRPKLSQMNCEQAKTCLQIALNCVENDRCKRPHILEILDDLNKVGNMTKEVPVSLEPKTNSGLPKHGSSSTTKRTGGLVILYVTTLGELRKAHYECNIIRKALHLFNVDFIEKDLTDRPDHLREVKQLLAGTGYRLPVPILSINGTPVADARKLLELNNEGRLQALFE